MACRLSFKIFDFQKHLLEIQSEHETILDLGPNNSQRLSADDKSFQNAGRFKLTIQVINVQFFIQNYKFLFSWFIGWVPMYLKTSKKRF